MSAMFSAPLPSTRTSAGGTRPQVTDHGRTCSTAATAFNQDISNWDTAAVTDMQGYVLAGATAFNQDISGWDTAQVTDMGYMFNGAKAFSRDLSGWNVLAVVNPTVARTSASMLARSNVHSF